MEKDRGCRSWFILTSNPCYLFKVHSHWAIQPCQHLFGDKPATNVRGRFLAFICQLQLFKTNRMLMKKRKLYFRSFSALNNKTTKGCETTSHDSDMITWQQSSMRGSHPTFTVKGAAMSWSLTIINTIIVSLSLYRIIWLADVGYQTGIAHSWQGMTEAHRLFTGLSSPETT